MTESTDTTTGQEEFRGTLNIPGENEPQQASILLDMEQQVVTVRFDAPVAGASEWEGSSVQVARRLKYDEVVFRTTDLPVETIELTWKCNASRLDDSLAGVIVPRPNKLRVSGEKGFVLIRQPGS